MSELTKTLYKWDEAYKARLPSGALDPESLDPYVEGRSDLASELESLLPAHNAEIREQAQREQKNADVEILRKLAIEYFPDNSPGWEFVDKVMGTIEITYYNERKALEAQSNDSRRQRA